MNWQKKVFTRRNFLILLLLASLACNGWLTWQNSQYEAWYEHESAREDKARQAFKTLDQIQEGYKKAGIKYEIDFDPMISITPFDPNGKRSENYHRFSALYGEEVESVSTANK